MHHRSGTCFRAADVHEDSFKYEMATGEIELYAQEISPIGPRVLVQGNPVYLGQPDLVGEVRATLLAALRAAVLWRQLGGSYWDFLLGRRALVAAAREWLAQGG